MYDNSIKITKVNETYIKVTTSEAIHRELNEHFSYMAPNYKFDPRYRNRLWNGKVYLYSLKTHQIYIGLLNEIIEFCNLREYGIKVAKNVILRQEFSLEEAKEFCKTLTITDKNCNIIEPRDYQIEAFAKIVRNKRRLILSPTSSGKSLVYYIFVRWLLQQNMKGFIIVPTTALCDQLQEEFALYSQLDPNINIMASSKVVYSGTDGKNATVPLKFSTWQSIYQEDASYFSDVDFLIIDEAHHVTAKSLIEIMIKCDKTKYRLGMTGTIKDDTLTLMTLQGLFGKISELIKTKELMDAGTISKLKPIKCCILSYSDEETKNLKKVEFNDEIEFLVTNKRRNRFIRNLCLSLPGNTLLLFKLIEHGQVLYDEIVKKVGNEYLVSLVYGLTPSEDRNKLREIIENQKRSITVASVGTFSTGINIINLNNIIPVHPTKSRIKILQSIGRGLRKGGDKTEVNVFDISDDLRHGDYVNHSMRHFMERIEIYDSQEFPYKFYTISLT